MSKLPKIPNEKQLTIKQAEFFKEWLSNGGNGTKAAMKVYDTTTVGSASQIAHENLSKLENPTRFYLEHRGIDLGKITDVLDEAMRATKWNDFTGEREPDHFVRLKAVDKITKVSGMENETQQQTNVQVNVFTRSKDQKDSYGI